MKAKELVDRYKAGERDFQGVGLSKAELHNARLNGTDSSGANLDYTILDMVNLDAMYPGS